jgi:hypothetical protein
MKLKLDENGNVVLKDGKPVYINDAGNEIVFDAAQAFQKIHQLTGENTSYKARFTEAETKLKGFEGIEDPAAAKKALETVANIDAGQLVAAGKVEEIKAAALRSAEEKLTASMKTANDKIKELTDQKAAVEGQLHDEMVGGGFARSKFVTEKIAVPPDMLRAQFGRHFKVEDGKTVAYGPDGKMLYSKTRMGEAANLDEALEILVDQYPHKDAILKGAGAAGGGSQGSNVAGGRDLSKLSPVDRMNAARGVTT